LVSQMSAERRIAGAIVYESIAYTDPAPHSQSLPRGLGLLYPGLRRKIARRRFAGDWTLVVHRRSSRAIARSLVEGMALLAGPGAAIPVRDLADLPVLGGLLRRRVPALADFGRSDHLSFWRAGIPAVMLTDTADLRNPHYHQPTDTPDTLDYERLAAIVGATAFALARLAGLTLT
ncbi:MAG TPA: M28 family peptidase, partial [Thermoanaerobaculia bacterium]|nr:M28 family peptidase [Thermoanaerobaculia bacterium]